MTAAPSRLLAARWLLDAGAGASACALLSNVRGREANDLREASARATLRPGIYALVVYDHEGLVVPMRACVGLPSSSSADLQLACTSGLAAVRSWFGAPSLPSLRLELEELLAVSGTSLGLPTALAFVAHFAPSSAPTRAVLASGRLDADGRVLPVSHLDAKLAAAAAENGDRVVLVPPGQRTHEDQIEVHTLEEAIAAALGPARVVAPSRVAVDGWIERARAESDPLRAIALLEAIDRDALHPADRARVHLELGTVLRHAGQSKAATEHHAQARALLETERLVVGAETAERYDLEVWLTAMDEFRLEEARAAAVRRLNEPFLSMRNELRCRGMLAQVLAMQGELEEAVSVREGNLALHALSDDLARVLPGTLVYLALDSARAGDAARFEHHAHRLLRATPPGDANQWRYTAYAIVRSLVALGRYEEAISWTSGAASFDGTPAPPATIELLRGHTPITNHPEMTMVRALVRALRRTSSAAKALALGARVSAPTGSGLVAWLAALVELEVALAERALGHAGYAARIARVRAALPALHDGATAYHAALLTCTESELEGELDRVFY